MSTVDLSLSLLKHFVPGCKARVAGVGTGRFFYFFYFIAHPKLSWKMARTFPNATKHFSSLIFSFHTLFHPRLCQTPFKPDCENMNGKQQNTGRGAASPPLKDGGGMGVEGSGEAGTAGGIAKRSRRAGRGIGGGKCWKNPHPKKSLLSNSLFTLNCIYRLLGDFCVSDSTYMCTYTGQ